MFGRAATTVLVLICLASGTGSAGLASALARSDFARTVDKGTTVHHAR